MAEKEGKREKEYKSTEAMLAIENGVGEVKCRSCAFVLDRPCSGILGDGPLMFPHPTVV